MENDRLESEVPRPGACAGVVSERAVQDRIIKLLRTKLGYEYLGNCFWSASKNSSQHTPTVQSPSLRSAWHARARPISTT